MKSITVLFRKETTPVQIALFLAGFRLYMGSFWIDIVNENHIAMPSSEEKTWLILPVNPNYDVSELLKHVALYIHSSCNKTIGPCTVGITIQHE